MNRATLHSILAGIASVIFALIIVLIGYYTPRENFSQFISLYFVAFIAFYVLWLNRQQWNFSFFLGLAVIVRLLLLFAVPELSNDFYRFIWDGELMVSGINPYAHVPNELISQQPFYSDLYSRTLWHGMGELSQANYSCYPVLNQLFFALPAYLFDSIEYNVIFYKVMLILADLGVIWIGRKILLFLQKPVHLIWLYALNPFVILEFTGNLHFEGVMIFFLLMGMYAVLKNNWMLAAVGFACAIQIKMIPLLLLPFMLKKLRWQNALGFVSFTLFLVIGFSLLLLNQAFYENMMTSVNLYFHTFEFNASVFNLIREYRLATIGYDNILEDGPFLSKITIVCLALLVTLRAHLKPSDIFTASLFAMSIYYLFATTVHPWYVATLLILSIFTAYKFALVWSATVMLSYFAYSNPDFAESGHLIALEYIPVLLIAAFEIYKNTKSINFGLQLKSFFSPS